MFLPRTRKNAVDQPEQGLLLAPRAFWHNTGQQMPQPHMAEVPILPQLRKAREKPGKHGPLVAVTRNEIVVQVEEYGGVGMTNIVLTAKMNGAQLTQDDNVGIVAREKLANPQFYFCASPFLEPTRREQRPAHAAACGTRNLP
jgi:hypothetical protein